MIRECSTSYHLQGGRLDDRIILTRRTNVRINVKLRQVFPSHFIRENALNVTRSECVSVALGPAYT
jgi:uncharacterized protein Veg